jgi:hypothetical protein
MFSVVAKGVIRLEKCFPRKKSYSYPEFWDLNGVKLRTYEGSPVKTSFLWA